MAGPNTRVAAADREAAQWHARLGVHSVSTETLEEFFAWRAVPAHAEAYRRVEQVWAASGKLGGDADIQAAVAEALDRGIGKRSRERSRRGLIGLAAVTAAVCLVAGGWFWLDGRGVHATAVGEQQVVQLDDGSTVRLDTGSRIRVRMKAGERRVVLEAGQALFDVTPDAARPFVVDAGGTRVTAVGTVFDVRRMEAGVRVTLVSGAVDVARDVDTAPARMSAGQQARVTRAGVSTRAVDAEAAVSWTEGRLVFEDTPLRQAVDEVNRYLTAPIRLEAGDMAERPVSGVFTAGDRGAFAHATAEGLGLDARVGEDGTLVLSRRRNN